jgi:C-terminal peptidase prc
VHLQVFEELWQVVNDEYLYQDFNGMDWDDMKVEYRERIQSGLSDEDFYHAMGEMVFRLGDDHSTFFSPEQAAEEDAGYAGDYNYVGIGVMTIAVPERQRITIISIFPDSPAEEAGLEVRDSIIAADGEPILDENGVRHHLLRGPEGSKMTLTVMQPGGDTRQVELTRQRISGAPQVPYQVLTTQGGKRIGYILLVTFSDNTIDDQVGEALRDMSATAPLDGVIIDNRMNNGGASNVLKGTLAYFTDGTLGHFVNRQGEKPLTVDGININDSQHLPVVVLTGDGTASFGEIFAGVLQDIGRAYVIGGTTAGNVEILYVYTFSDGSRAWIAHDTFRPLNQPDQDWEATGILPDLTIYSNWDEVTVVNDPVVIAAIEFIASD